MNSFAAILLFLASACWGIPTPQVLSRLASASSTALRDLGSKAFSSKASYQELVEQIRTLELKIASQEMAKSPLLETLEKQKKSLERQVSKAQVDHFLSNWEASTASKLPLLEASAASKLPLLNAEVASPLISSARRELPFERFVEHENDKRLSKYGMEIKSSIESQSKKILSNPESDEIAMKPIPFKNWVERENAKKLPAAPPPSKALPDDPHNLRKWVDRHPLYVPDV